MAKTQKISQKKWLKGVNAAAQAFAQPPGSFPRASNLIFIRRGSLVTCDGSQLIAAFNGEPLPQPDRKWEHRSGLGNMLPLLLVVVFVASGVLRAVFGRLFGSVATGGLAGGVFYQKTLKQRFLRQSRKTRLLNGADDLGALLKQPRILVFQRFYDRLENRFDQC